MLPVLPSIDTNGVPYCSQEGCPNFDGKRCRAMGFRPDNICEPAVIEMVRKLAQAKEALQPFAVAVEPLNIQQCKDSELLYAETHTSWTLLCVADVRRADAAYRELDEPQHRGNSK